MRLLIQADYDDMLMTLSAKTMLLKMYYELDEIDALESLLSSMTTFIHRKKIIGYHKNLYGNTIRFTKKLIKVNPFNKKEKEKLKKEIMAAKPLPERGWLLEQVENL